MSFTNLQKTIALTSGVFVLSGAIALVIIAATWQGPGGTPPEENVETPINVSSAPQTKTGDLTLGNLLLDGVGNEGDIVNADQTIGYNGLLLKADDRGKVKIELLAGAGAIAFYTDNALRGGISGDGGLYILELSDCSLRVNQHGKVECNGGVLNATQQLVALAQESCTAPSDGSCTYKDDAQYRVNTEEVIKVVMGMYLPSEHYSYGKVWFYINEVEQWSQFRQGGQSWTETRYYHVKAGDMLKVSVRAHAWYGKRSEVNARIFVLNSVRENITEASTTTGGNILYWYNEFTRGLMNEIPTYYGADPPQSVIISATEEATVKWKLD